MDLAAARDLKWEIRRVLEYSHAAVAVGIAVADRPHGYKVAVLPHTARDYRMLLDVAAFRKLRRRDEVDVEVMGEVHRLSGAGVPMRTNGPLQIGASIGHHAGGDGSLGFFAVQRTTGRRGVVSCSHTIALADRGREGDEIISPSSGHGGRSPRDVVAMLDGRYPLLGGTQPQPIDCAFAYVADDLRYDAACVEGGRLVAQPAVARVRLEVSKDGFVTGKRNGVVTKIELDNIPVRYGSIKAFFHDVLQIESTSEGRFAADGDSGALVYTTRGFEPVGLLFAASYSGGAYDAGYTWAHPIGDVLRALDVDVLVT